MEIWHEITQEKACGVRRGSWTELKGTPTAKGQAGLRDRGGRKRQSRRKTKRRVSREPRDTKEAVSGSNAAERPNKLRTEKRLFHLPKIIGNSKKKPQGGQVATV